MKKFNIYLFSCAIFLCIGLAYGDRWGGFTITEVPRDYIPTNAPLLQPGGIFKVEWTVTGENTANKIFSVLINNTPISGIISRDFVSGKQGVFKLVGSYSMGASLAGTQYEIQFILKIIPAAEYDHRTGTVDYAFYKVARTNGATNCSEKMSGEVPAYMNPQNSNPDQIERLMLRPQAAGITKNPGTCALL